MPEISRVADVGRRSDSRCNCGYDVPNEAMIFGLGAMKSWEYLQGLVSFAGRAGFTLTGKIRSYRQNGARIVGAPKEWVVEGRLLGPVRGYQTPQAAL